MRIARMPRDTEGRSRGKSLITGKPTSCSGAWQDFLLDLRTNLPLRDLQVVCALKIQPVLRRRTEIPRQTHGGVHGDWVVVSLFEPRLILLQARAHNCSQSSWL